MIIVIKCGSTGTSQAHKTVTYVPLDYYVVGEGQMGTVLSQFTFVAIVYYKRHCVNDAVYVYLVAVASYSNDTAGSGYT